MPPSPLIRMHLLVVCVRACLETSKSSRWVYRDWCHLDIFKSSSVPCQETARDIMLLWVSLHFAKESHITQRDFGWSAAHFATCESLVGWWLRPFWQVQQITWFQRIRLVLYSPSHEVLNWQTCVLAFSLVLLYCLACLPHGTHLAKLNGWRATWSGCPEGCGIREHHCEPYLHWK